MSAPQDWPPIFKVYFSSLLYHVYGIRRTAFLLIKPWFNLKFKYIKLFQEYLIKVIKSCHPFSACLFQLNSWHWLDGSPLIEYEKWNIPDIYKATPHPPDTNQSFHGTMVGMSKTTMDASINACLKVLQPTDEEECVGSFVSNLRYYFFTIPCHKRFHSKLTCDRYNDTVNASMSTGAFPRPAKSFARVVDAMEENNICVGYAIVRDGRCLISQLLPGKIIQSSNNITMLSSDTKLITLSSPFQASSRNVKPSSRSHYFASLFSSNVTEVRFSQNMFSNIVHEFVLEFWYCPSASFQCDDQSCIPLSKQCDNVPDCWPHGEDEDDCNNVTCSHGSNCLLECSRPECVCGDALFQCLHSGCISPDVVCDGVPNCPDGSDEMFCPHVVCVAGERMCADGRWCVPLHLWFDGVEHCPDASDELPDQNCPKGFQCTTSVECIPSTRLNDGIPDCLDSSDEIEHVIHVASVNQKVHCPTGLMPCNTSLSLQCFHPDNMCFYNTAEDGSIYHCRQAYHLRSCERFECTNSFKCPGSYCIPYGKLCDGTVDCQDGADEVNCPVLTCANMFHCRVEGLCIHPSQLCDGVVDCRESMDDEKYCEPALCHGSGCNAASEHVLIMYRLPYKVLVVDMHSMNLLAIRSAEKDPMKSVISMSIVGNAISVLPDMAFVNCPWLAFLYVQINKLSHISTLAFQGLFNLRLLDLSNNLMHFLDSKSFKELKELVMLNLSGNNLRHVSPDIFEFMKKLGRLFHTDIRLCCMVGSHVECSQMVPKSIHSYPCHHQSSSRILVFSSVASSPVIIVLNVWSALLLMHEKKKRIMLMLALADVGYTAYLLIFTVKFFLLSQRFSLYVYEWPASWDVSCRI